MKLSGLILLALLPVSVTGCEIHGASAAFDGSTSIVGSGNRTSETRNVPTFRGVAYANSGSLEVTVGKAQKLTIEIDDNLLKEVRTEVRDGVLYIESKHGYQSKKGLKVTAQVSAFDSVSLSGSVAARITGIQSDKFKADISGSGSLNATGAADQFTIDVSGSASADLKSLHSRSASVDISGSGSVRLYASDSLSANISGSGSIEYSGSPKKITKDVSGSGVIRARD